MTERSDKDETKDDESTGSPTPSSVDTTGMVHSEQELRHGLQHLLMMIDDDGNELQGHETMMLYRNVRKKYGKTDHDKANVKEGLRGLESFRTVDQGILAAYRASMVEKGLQRDCSALYVTINPRHVSQGLKTTYDLYNTFTENKAGLTKQQVRKGDREDFLRTLDSAFRMNVLKSESRHRLEMIDVDDSDPTTWLQRIRDAIPEECIELILETKNGYHVVYHGKRMKPKAHARLVDVLKDNPGKGPDEKVTKSKGPSIQCALPGGYQADHKTRILFCSCQHKKAQSTPN